MKYFEDGDECPKCKGVLEWKLSTGGSVELRCPDCRYEATDAVEMSFLEKWRAWERRLDLSRLKGYVFKKWVFRSAIVLLVLLFLGLWAEQGFGDPSDGGLYVVCSVGGGPCLNPLYQNDVWLGKYPGFPVSETLPEGFVYGDKPGFFYEWGVALGVFLLVGAFVLNHLLYNRKVPVWKKIKEAVRDEED